jgi:hypothetical protein
VKAYRRRRFTATLVLNLGTRYKCVVHVTPRALCPLGRTLVSTEEEAGWVTEPVGTVLEKIKYLDSAWIRTPYCPK